MRIKKLITVAGLALLTASTAGIAGCGSNGSAQAARCDEIKPVPKVCAQLGHG